MPQGEGTYGSQVGRPSKKRTSFVNDNGWDNKTKGNDYASIIAKYKSQGQTPRQYSNPIDTGQSREHSWPLYTGQKSEYKFANPVQRRGEQIMGTHPIGDPSKPVMRKHPIGDRSKKITGQLM